MFSIMTKNKYRMMQKIKLPALKIYRYKTSILHINYRHYTRRKHVYIFMSRCSKYCDSHKNSMRSSPSCFAEKYNNSCYIVKKFVKRTLTFKIPFKKNSGKKLSG